MKPKTLAERILADRENIPQLGQMGRRKGGRGKWQAVVKVDLERERVRLDGDTSEMPWSTLELRR
jgi:hypothetical protein